MADSLQALSLILDSRLVAWIEQEAERRRVSVSELVETLLARQLGGDPPPSSSLERIRRLRTSLGPMPDSARIVREDRDRGW